MAITISLYNHTPKLFANGEVDLGSLKVQLLTDAAAFTASHTALASVNNVGAYEVDGSGWSTGGEAIGNAAVTTVTTNDAKLDGDDISVTATGGSIGPAYKAVIYDDADAADAPLAFIDFGGAQEAGEGTPFKITWSPSGIITWTLA